ncbi:MAG: hypothetical protein QXR45_16355 [Candidatus Bathyarchaeia archaeon]
MQVYQEWVPYVPPGENVELKHWVSSGVSYVNVSISFPHPMFNVSSWGDPIIIGNSISVDAEIWQYTGPTMPLITIVQHTYELGTLSPGEYNFTFMTWGQTVKSITFKIKRDIAIIKVWCKKNIVPQGMTFDLPRKTFGLIVVNVTNPYREMARPRQPIFRRILEAWRRKQRWLHRLLRFMLSSKGLDAYCFRSAILQT